ncbi:nSTAND3 domain-containing NTPase [Candidatus Contubernalis alkaliaceticus]|uniref:nSTAND3 domain-containing NTPase n=1 Tax=Candidatus Contubernalis alkaliaceticus TaxID=338645 RepID=UPI001F4BEFB5|nr:sigma 54-interacting transcriptional regulator [Candidatus Contubernalis alkalaceticus]UNC91298.1 ATP-binding protein [Candidatus Contubernalis alkalaceticus]
MNNINKIYRGYEYQIDVSVWCALHLIFEREKAEYIEIEPASLEDIEAEFKIESDKSEVIATTPGKKLIVQVKSKSNGPWAIVEVSNILIKSKSNTKPNKLLRVSPIALMQKNEECIYVLVTDADVSKDLQPFCVPQIGDFSKAKEFPGTIKRKLNPTVENIILAHRFTIFSKFTWDYANKLSEDILRKFGNVPMQFIVDCRQEIAESVRKRLLGKSSRRLTKTDIEDIIKKFQGLPQPNIFLNYHVMPHEHTQARKILNKYYAILIYGEPGVGKSLFAEALAYEYKKQEIPFQVVTELDMPRGILDAFNSGMPVIAHLDDPWGRITPGQTAVEWCNSIVNLLRQTREDRRIIIVSRESVLEDVYPLDSLPIELKRIAFRIDKDSYSEKQRIKMIERRLKYLPNSSLNHRKFIRENLRDILDSLTYPVEIIAVIERISEQVPQNYKEFQLTLEKCKQENLIQTYVDELCSKPYNQKLAVILAWVLTRTSPEKWQEDSETFREWITHSNIRLSEGIPVTSTIKYLLNIGWLKVDEYRGLCLRDPRIEQAIDGFFNRYSDECKDIIKIIFNNLLECDRVSDILRMIEGLITQKLRPSDKMLSTLDDWLTENALTCEQKEFPMALRALGNWHVKDKPWAILARIFFSSQINKERPKRKKTFFEEIDFDNLTREDIEAIKKCPQSKTLAEKIIRGYFPEHHSGFNLDEVIIKFNQFDWCFPDACLEGILNSKRKDMILPVFALGLKLWGNELQLEQALEYVIQEYNDASVWYDKWQNDYGKKIGEGIFNAGYEAHLLEEPGEIFIPLQETLDILVAGLALRKDPMYLEYLASRSELTSSCFNAFENNLETVFNEGSFEKCFSHANETYIRKNAWRAIGTAKLYNLVPKLLDAMEASHVDEVRGALEGLAKLYEAEKFGAIINKKANQCRFVSKCRLYEASKNFEGPDKYISPKEYHQAININFSEDEQEVLNILPKSGTNFDDIAGIWDNLATILQEKVISLARATDITISKRALIFAACGQNGQVLPLIKHWYNCDEKEYRLVKLQAIIQYPEEYNKALEKAIEDDHYRCRKFAIENIAVVANNNPILKQKIIDMACNDPSALIRETCLSIIGEFVWSEGISGLIKLLKDKRDRSEGWELPDHHVARTAALQISNFSNYGDLLLQPLLDFLTAGKKVQPDIYVHVYVIICLNNWTGNKNVIDFLSGLLLDDWYIKTETGSGYIRRFAAVWALVGVKVNQIYEKLKTCTSDADDRIAGPAMIALANYGDLGRESLRKIIQSDEKKISKNRKFLAAVILLATKTNSFPFMEELASGNDPILELIIKIKDNQELFGKIPLTEWLNNDSNLSSIDLNKVFKDLKGLTPALYYIMDFIVGKEWEKVCKFNILEAINKTMPNSIGVISIRYFNGYE